MMRFLAAAVVTLSAAAARAQPVPDGELEHTALDPMGQGSLLVGNGQTAKAGTYRASAVFLYSQGHLSSGGAMVIRDRVSLLVQAGAAVTDWLEVTAELPIVLSQRSSLETLPLNAAGLGTPFVSARLNILDGAAPVSLSAALGVGLPIGSPEALGNGGLAVTPRITVGRVFERMMVGVELGGLVREQKSLAAFTGHSSDELGSQISLSGMVSSVGDGLRTELSARLFAPLTGGQVGAELLAGMRYPLGGLELYALLGPGLFGHPDTPGLRVYLGAAYGNGGPPRPRCVEGTDDAVERCPDLDRDGDGVPNGKDLAPLEPEDLDGFEDQDGKPDPDNDGDGVVDLDDRCPMDRGPRENQGCPDVDSDGDGVVDRLDKAPREPEDKDGFQDEDGVPEPDNDGDGLLDGKDACPDQAGIVEERGCPAKDDDLDGVPNHLDSCRTEHGEASNQGCPASKPQRVVLGPDTLTLLDPVTFTAAGRPDARSVALLDQVAVLLRDKTFLSLVQVGCHTDEGGEKAVALSQARADAVKAQLVKAGVAEGRLKAVGFGATVPRVPGTSAAARAANRRVELTILARD